MTDKMYLVEFVYHYSDDPSEPLVVCETIESANRYIDE